MSTSINERTINLTTFGDSQVCFGDHLAAALLDKASRLDSDNAMAGTLRNIAVKVMMYGFYVHTTEDGEELCFMDTAAVKSAFCSMPTSSMQQVTA